MTERQQPPQEPSNERRFARIRRTMDRINAWFEKNPEFWADMMKYSPHYSPHSYRISGIRPSPMAFVTREIDPANVDTGRLPERDNALLDSSLWEELDPDNKYLE